MDDWELLPRITGRGQYGWNEVVKIEWYVCGLSSSLAYNRHIWGDTEPLFDRGGEYKNTSSFLNSTHIILMNHDHHESGPMTRGIPSLLWSRRSTIHVALRNKSVFLMIENLIYLLHPIPVIASSI